MQVSIKGVKNKHSLSLEKIIFRKQSSQYPLERKLNSVRSTENLLKLQKEKNERRKTGQIEPLDRKTKKQIVRKTDKSKAKEETLIQLLKEYQQYKGEYMSWGRSLINRKCFKHINKKGKYILKLNEGVQSSICSDCAVFVSQLGIKVNKITLDNIDNRMDQIEEFLKGLQQTSQDLLDTEQGLWKSQPQYENLQINQSRIIDGFIQQIEENINAANKDFVLMYQDHIKNQIVSINEGLQFIASEKQTLTKIQKDLLDNFNAIQESFSEAQYKQIYNYYQEVVRKIQQQNNTLRTSLLKSQRDQSMDKILQNFKENYLQFLKTNFLNK